jgi:hypothetical protein
MFNISIEAPPDRFLARITARSSGQLRFAASQSSTYQVVRTRRDIDSAPADHYSVFAQLRGVSVIHQCGEPWLSMRMTSVFPTGVCRSARICMRDVVRLP